MISYAGHPSPGPKRGPYINPSPNRLRSARIAAGLTQHQLSRRSGVSSRTVHAIENGRSCRQATKRLLLYALGIPFSEHHDYF